MAAEVVESNEDLLREVLLRLPAKSLLKFKCVSKRWLALISNPKFCHSHALRQRRSTPRASPSALLLGTTPPSRCLIYDSKDFSNSSKDSKVFSNSNSFRSVEVPGMSIAIMHSCNGLMLLRGDKLVDEESLSSFELAEFHSCNPRQYFICNPATSQFISISNPFETPVLSLFLSFDPLKSSHYKVIAIGFDNCFGLWPLVDVNYVISVYSSETGSWSERQVSFSDHDSCAYCYGAVYWYSGDASSKYFDVENHCFRKFPMPSGNDREKVRYFGEFGGHLHLVLESPDRVMEFDILELKEDRSEWLTRFHIDLNNLMRVTFPLLDLDNELQTEQFLKFVSVVRGEEEKDSILVLFVGDRVMTLNLLDCSFRELSGCGAILREKRSLFGVFPYFENLSWIGPFGAS